ncbi:MAG: putative Ig domain-containing protein, partial [Bdellovibrionales bacterium]|nr:putative Ig domain-containing protein [Bdellovibrionales bacterium]
MRSGGTSIVCPNLRALFFQRSILAGIFAVLLLTKTSASIAGQEQQSSATWGFSASWIQGSSLGSGGGSNQPCFPTLRYNNPSALTIGQTIAPIAPLINCTGAVLFSVNSPLPPGLTLNESTGVITGKPTEITAAKDYVITASTPGGTATAGVRLQVNDLLAMVSYVNPGSYSINKEIKSLVPLYTGGKALSFSITPALPAGLSFDPSTAVISGTPTVLSTPVKTYIIGATNSAGTSATSVMLEVVDLPPVIAYDPPPLFFVNEASSGVVAKSTGGRVVRYSVAPAFPKGLAAAFSVGGRISGTPTELRAPQDYVITASNSGGQTQTTVKLEVRARPPVIAYSAPSSLRLGAPISAIGPISSGGVVEEYSISPGLPSGLSFSSKSGVISGIPLSVSASTRYTVTAKNSGGTVEAAFTFQVKDRAPSISYQLPEVLAVNLAVEKILPFSMGGAVQSYEISPRLPMGLTFDSKTGAIEGTPLQEVSRSEHTVVARNSEGTSVVQLMITVSKQVGTERELTLERALTIFKRVSLVNPTNKESREIARITQNTEKSTQARISDLVAFATSTKEFYNTSLVRLFAGSTNRYNNPNVRLNDAIALNIGLVRDGIPYKEVLYGDHYYEPGAGLNLGTDYRGPIKWRAYENLAYENLHRMGFDLRDAQKVLVKSASQTETIYSAEQANYGLFSSSGQMISLAGRSTSGADFSASPDIAGVITTRAMADAFLNAGTNRRMVRFLLSNYLCHDIDVLKDTSAPDHLIRKDVDRSPGGSPSLFQTSCKGCHSIMDPLANAFAYVDFRSDRFSYMISNDLGCEYQQCSPNGDDVHTLRCKSESERTVNSVHMLSAQSGQRSVVTLKVGTQVAEYVSEPMLGSVPLSNPQRMEMLRDQINAGSLKEFIAASVGTVAGQKGQFLKIDSKTALNFTYDYQSMVTPLELTHCSTFNVYSDRTNIFSPAVSYKVKRNA